MQLFPAIDLRGGNVVRLTQGDYDKMTVYGEDPCAQARAFLDAGAKNLHVVDLDGAKDGTLSNYDTINTSGISPSFSRLSWKSILLSKVKKI